jgi:protein CMS1
MASDNDLQEPMLERLSATPEPANSAKSSKKRKRGQDLEQGAKKAAKKSKSKKGNAEEDDDIDIEAGVNKAFSHMDSQLLADYVAQRTRKYESDLSAVELEDKYIPGADG